MNITAAMVRGWKAKGYPLDDAAELAEHLGAQERTQAAPAELVEKIAEARLRKLTAEASLNEHKLAVQRGLFVPIEGEVRRGLEIAAAIRSAILRIPAELPQQVVGLDYPGTLKRCEDYAHAVLVALADESAFPVPQIKPS